MFRPTFSHLRANILYKINYNCMPNVHVHRMISEFVLTIQCMSHLNITVLQSLKYGVIWQCQQYWEFPILHWGFLFRVTYDIAIDVYAGDMFDPDLLHQLTTLYQPPVSPDPHAVLYRVSVWRHIFLNPVILVLWRTLKNINGDSNRLGYDPVTTGKHFTRMKLLPLS